jgi:hypothetical protein
MRNVPIIECFLSIISIWWTIVLYNSSDFFRVPKAFEPLAGIDNFGWGSIFLVAAGLKIYGILVHKRWIRRVGLTFSVFLYALICSGYILVDPMSTGTGVYFALAVLALYQIREVKAGAN